MPRHKLARGASLGMTDVRFACNQIHEEPVFLSLRVCLRIDLITEASCFPEGAHTRNLKSRSRLHATEGSAPGYGGTGYRVSIQPLGLAGKILRSAPRLCAG